MIKVDLTSVSLTEGRDLSNLIKEDNPGVSFSFLLGSDPVQEEQPPEGFRSTFNVGTVRRRFWDWLTAKRITDSWV